MGRVDGRGGVGGGEEGEEWADDGDEGGEGGEGGMVVYGDCGNGFGGDIVQ